MRTFYILIACFTCVMLLPGCKKNMTVEEAQSLSGAFKQASSTAMPRSIDGIVAQHNASRLNSHSTVADSIATADSEPAPALPPGELAEYYAKRAQAAELVGRSNQALRDWSRAVQLAQAGHQVNEFQRLGWEIDQGWAEVSFGDSAMGFAMIRRAIARIRNLPVSSNPFVNGHRSGRIAGYEGILAIMSARTGNLDEANNALSRSRVALGTMDALIDSAKRANVPLGPDVRTGALLARSSSETAQAFVFRLNGDFKSAVKLLRASVERIDSSRLNALQGVSESQLARIRTSIRAALAEFLSELGLDAEAEAVAREAFSDALKAMGPDSGPTVRALLTLSDIYLQQERFDDVLRLSELTQSVLARVGASPASYFLVKARLHQATALAGKEMWRDSAKIFMKLLEKDELLQTGPLTFLAVNPAASLAYIKSDDVTLARGAIDLELAWKNKIFTQGQFERAECEAFQGVVLLRQGRHDLAKRQLEAALPILLDPHKIPEHLGKIQRLRLRMVFDALAGIWQGDMKGNDARKAQQLLGLAELIRSGPLTQTMTSSALRMSPKAEPYAALIRQEQNVSLLRAAAYTSLGNTLTMAASSTDSATLDTMRENARRLSEAHAMLLSKIRANVPDYQLLTRSALGNIQNVSNLLHRDEALVVFLLNESRTYAWVLTAAGGITFKALPISREQIRASVRKVFQALSPEGVEFIGDIPEFDVQTAWELYCALLAPLRPQMKQATSIILVPDDALRSLPLAVLPLSRPSLARREGLLFEKYRDVDWLDKHYATSTMPSVGAFASVRTTSPSHAQHAFVGFGNPVFSALPPAQAVAGPQGNRGLLRAVPNARDGQSYTLKDLPPLPETEAELSKIARILGADASRDLFVGLRATEEQVYRLNSSKELRRYRVISFATHGLVAGDLDGLFQPALAMTSPALTSGLEDGLLTMQEVLRLDLDADWVVLSACNTAAGEDRAAEAFTGLSKAFFFAGSRALLVSNWPVHSSATQELMVALFSSGTGDATLSRSQMLQRAMQTVRNQKEYMTKGGRAAYSYAHPLFWAPFSLVGDGGGRKL